MLMLLIAGWTVTADTPTPPPDPSTDPKTFPADIARYHPTLKESYRMSAAGALAHLRTNDGPAQVARFYADFAAHEHWTIDPDLISERPTGNVLIYRKGDRLLRVDAFTNPLRKTTEVYLMVARDLPSPTPSASPRPRGTR
ncbi:MAG TPA: hypothetical protein VN461_14410 [Vicinamibacteria bacterium]|jgi:hypothetical protein|nr:hypothetical protein [Vicinamibacteria bacterium]